MQVKMKIELDPGEYAIAQVIATMRRSINTVFRVRDQRRDTRRAVVDLDLLGAVAEIAFCKWRNVYPDLTILPRHGSADAMIGGKKVDIKATDRKDGRLLATTGKEIDAADIYVLAIVEGPVVEFVGYALAAELLQDKTLKDLGHGATHAMEQGQLRKFKDASFGIPESAK